jgi:carbon-monoxide dehydrogenase medium subunit
VISHSFEYSSTTELKDALTLIAGGAKPLAGGMSLIPMMKLRLAAPDHLVDLGRIQELNYIREEGGQIRIGATTTHRQVESSPVLLRACPLLPKTASYIGDVQVRNTGTIGGSLAHADPAADYPAAVLALEAQLRLASATGERTVGVSDFLLDSFTTSLEPGEIIVEVIVPSDGPDTGTAYMKMAQPASGFALAGVAVRVRRSGNVITMARIGVTGVAPIAYRARAAEMRLEGSPGADADVAEAAKAASDDIEALSDLHASANYRKHLASAYTARAIRAALAELDR